MPSACQANGGTAVCALGDLAVGDRADLVFGGLVRVGTAPGARLTLTAVVSFDGTDALEASPADDGTIVVLRRARTADHNSAHHDARADDCRRSPAGWWR